MNNLTDTQKLHIDLASEKGASSWLTSLPIKEFGYVLNKQEFNDALTLRYLNTTAAIYRIHENQKKRAYNA